jgi:hypothetical protein
MMIPENALAHFREFSRLSGLNSSNNFPYKSNPQGAFDVALRSNGRLPRDMDPYGTEEELEAEGEAEQKRFNFSEDEFRAYCRDERGMEDDEIARLCAVLFGTGLTPEEAGVDNGEVRYVAPRAERAGVGTPGSTEAARDRRKTARDQPSGNMLPTVGGGKTPSQTGLTVVPGTGRMTADIAMDRAIIDASAEYGTACAWAKLRGEPRPDWNEWKRNNGMAIDHRPRRTINIAGAFASRHPHAAQMGGGLSVGQGDYRQMDQRNGAPMAFDSTNSASRATTEARLGVRLPGTAWSR